MSLSDDALEKLTTPKPGPITTRLPGKFARTNAALIAGEVKKAQEQGRGN